MFFFLPFLFSACSARVELESDEQKAAPTPVAAKEVPAVTVAAIEGTSDEVYFDLIAETTNCLGENLWFGGKLEGATHLAPGNAGADSPKRTYEVTELTATGLSSNQSYVIENSSKTLKAYSDEDGVIYIQLSEGKLRLAPKAGSSPVIVAYNPSQSDDYFDGVADRWSCN
ncbi:MAG: hypothetical protein LPK14_04810 [Hymenobacteraceae bacterium]|nr:hypothetical protein [Hymenobacteraceae bacterium]